MGPPRAVGLLVALLIGYTASWAAAKANTVLTSAPARSTEAYATLVYGNEFVLAARVLGQSLRESKTTRDMVALTTGSLSASSEVTLAADGWRTVHVPPVANPGKGPQSGGFPPRFAYVYTKLYIFRMTEYKKIVFLDADVLVLRNMDAIFRCPGFCAALRHSERFNTGVMSLTPSVELYDDMMAKVTAMPSYTGGDQGFLNSYFSGFAHAPLFDPETPYTPDQYKYMRLPTTFNADIGLFVVGSNHWMIARESLYVIHYTLGPFKPWVWWSGWLVAENPAWQDVRNHLPPDSKGHKAGRSGRQIFFERWMLLFPWAVTIAALYLGWAHLHPWTASLGAILRRGGRGGGGIDGAAAGEKAGSGEKAAARGAAAARAVASSGSGSGLSGTEASVVLRVAGGGGGGGAGHHSSEVLPKGFLALSLAASYTIVVVVTVTTILIVPQEVAPAYGWTLSYEWGFMLFALAYGSMLRYVYRAGRRAGHHPAVQPKHHHASPLPRNETAASAAFLVTSLLLAPWLGRLLGITSFAGTIVATVFIGLGVVIVGTIQFAFLPAQWYIAGRMSAAGAGGRDA